MSTTLGQLSGNNFGNIEVFFKKNFIDNKWIAAVTAIFVLIYASHYAPRLPKTFDYIFDNPVARSIFFFLIAYIYTGEFNKSVITAIVLILVLEMICWGKIGGKRYKSNGEEAEREGEEEDEELRQVMEEEYRSRLEEEENRLNGNEEEEEEELQEQPMMEYVPQEEMNGEYAEEQNNFPYAKENGFPYTAEENGLPFAAEQNGLPYAVEENHVDGYASFM